MKNNKSLGQHWLKNRAILDEIADLAADIGPAAEKNSRVSTICLEIGPGLGTLTSSLLKRFAKVIAVEFDPRLAANLPKSFPGKNLTVIHGDILTADIPALISTNPQPTSTPLISANPQPTPQPAAPQPQKKRPQKIQPKKAAPVPPEDYVIVGNIPYYITSPIIRKVTNLSPAPRRIVLLVQKEVAERVAVDPDHGLGSHSLLSLMAGNSAAVKLGPVVPAAEFTPPPKVDSRVLILEPLPAPRIPDAVFSTIRLGFSNPRKKLSANLAGHPFSKADWEGILRREGINPNARAEDLGFRDWENLHSARNAPAPPSSPPARA